MYTFPRLINCLCRWEEAIFLNRMLLLLTNDARGNMFSNEFLETRMSEMHADGIEGADCSGMIKIVMVPCDDVRQQARWDVDFIFLKNKLIIVDVFNFK